MNVRGSAGAVPAVGRVGTPMGRTAKDSDLSTLPLDAVDRWVAALGAIPPASRVYDVTPRRAEIEFGITSAIASLLVDRGLPRASFEGEARFSWSDLHYIALRLGSARLYLRTMRSWAHSVANAALCGSQIVGLRYRTYASPGATVDVLLPEGRRVKAVIGSDQIVARLNVRMANFESAFPPSVQRVLHEAAAAFDFYILPPTLAGDVEFACRAGLGGCLTASRLVVSECQQRGIEARLAFGLVLAPPRKSVWAIRGPQQILSCSPFSGDSPGWILRAGPVPTHRVLFCSAWPTVKPRSSLVPLGR
jgi:hypothetical protein